MKFHLDIPNCYLAKARTRIILKLIWKLNNFETEKRCQGLGCGRGRRRGGGGGVVRVEATIFELTNGPDLIHTPIKFHEYITNGNLIMACIRMFTNRQHHDTIRLLFGSHKP